MVFEIWRQANVPLFLTLCAGGDEVGARKKEKGVCEWLDNYGSEKRNFQILPFHRRDTFGAVRTFRLVLSCQ